MSYVAGDFVFCRFPKGEQGARDEPGDPRHTVYVLSTRNGWALVVYTTTTFEPAMGTRIVGVMDFNDTKANRLGQERAFRFDARTMAQVPLIPSYFPMIERPSHALFRHGQPADETLRRTLEVRALAAHRAGVIDLRGPISQSGMDLLGEMAKAKPSPAPETTR